jgi:hypothetical protein
MKIDRKELLAILNRCAPALSSNKNQLEELSCFWFSGKHVEAYDDLIGVRVDFKTEFTGGVRGEKLLRILDASFEDDVEVEEADDANFDLKIGEAWIKLASRKYDDWFWEPKVPEDEGYIVTKEFIEAVKLTLISVGEARIQNPEQRGITIIQNGAGVADLYSTDAATISYMPVVAKDSVFSTFDHERVILPTEFCEQLLKIGEGAELRFDENAVYCLAEVEFGGKSRNVLLFSKLVPDDSPEDIAGTVKFYDKPGGFPIPNKMSPVLDRATVLLGDGAPLLLSVKEGFLYLYAESPQYGEVDDRLPLKGLENQNELKVKVDPALVKRGLEGRETMMVADNCLLLRGPGKFLHIVSLK